LTVITRFIAFTTIALVSGAAGSAQQTPGDTLLTVGQYLDFERVGNPQISPDGKSVVYTRGWVDRINDRWESAIWIVNADGTRNRFLVKGSSPVWSPDGTRIAYLAQAEQPSGSQIFVRWMDAEGATSQITRVIESPGSLKWSPDGKSIGFSMLVPKADEWSVEMPPAPPNAKWTAPPRVVNKLHYRFDRSGFLKTGYLHLFLVPADGGSPRQLTSGEWSVGASNEGAPFGVGWDFSPDGKTIYFDGNDDSGADLAYRDSNIFSLDVASLAIKRLTTERGRWSRPTVSPDGSKIAYAGFPAVKQTYKVADLWVMNRDGTGTRNLSSAYDRDAGFGLIWARDGSGIYLNPEDKGSVNLVFIPVAGGTVKPVTTETQILRVSSISTAGVMVGTRTSFSVPADVVKLTPNAKQGVDLTQLTWVNDDLMAGKRLASFEEVWYPSTGGARIQGWIVKPPSFDPKKKYPMLLEIHGGPHGMYNVGFDYMWHTWAANGYVVLYTNPRGSTGYGTAFGNAIDQAYPSVDYDDLMAGVDSVIGRGYIDEKQLYVAGCSGGGGSLELGHRPHHPIRGRRGPLPGDQLAQHDGPDRHSPLRLQLLREAVLGIAGPMAQAVADHVRGERDHTDGVDDGRAGSQDADVAVGGVLRRAQGARGADDAAAVQRRVARDPVAAVELDPNPALHDELVQEVRRAPHVLGRYLGCVGNGHAGVIDDGTAGVAVEGHGRQHQGADSGELLIGADPGSSVRRGARVGDGGGEVTGAVLVEVDPVAGVTVGGRPGDIGREASVVVFADRDPGETVAGSGGAIDPSRQIASVLLPQIDPADGIASRRRPQHVGVEVSFAPLPDLEPGIPARAVAVGLDPDQGRDQIAAALEIVVLLEVDSFLEIAARLDQGHVDPEVAGVILVEVEAFLFVVVGGAEEDLPDQAAVVRFVDVNPVIQVGEGLVEAAVVGDPSA
jgi:dipeptidyl aminopeptidase/acylaminoacyl peptidase